MDLKHLQDLLVAHWMYGFLYLVPPRYPLNLLWGFSFFLRGILGLYRPHPGEYAINALIGLDQFANAVAGGDPRETISSRSAKARDEGREWGCLMCAFLGWAATKIEGKPTDHCTQSLEPQVGSDAVVPD